MWQDLHGHQPRLLLARHSGKRVCVVDLDPLLQDPTVTEIMCYSFDDIWVERKGRVHPVGSTFTDDTQYRQVIEKMVSAGGRRIDESSPVVDARLPDGGGAPGHRRRVLEHREGQRLFISQKTVKNHLASIYHRLDACNRTQAVLRAVRMGIVRLD